MHRHRSAVSVFLILLTLPFFQCRPVPSHDRTLSRPRNIILFIGDGMGAAHRQAARLAAGGQLAMDRLPVQGGFYTGSANSAVTDSAAAATAMATGVKTYNGLLGMSPDQTVLTTILEQARHQGKSVGLITNTKVTHATPAGFAAHVPDRRMFTAIAGQMAAAGIDVLLGGGEDDFLPDSATGCFPGKGHRTDHRNLIEEMRKSGYTCVCGPEEFSALQPAKAGKLLGLFSDDGMERPFAPTLADMTAKALAILGKDPDGFFLMVEGGQIDWAGHDNDAANAIGDTLDLDRAVAVAAGFAARDGRTLLIVTADHETGGMAVSARPTGRADEDGPFKTADDGTFYVTWETRQHTGLPVPVTACGPGSAPLQGEHENTFLHTVMKQALPEPEAANPIPQPANAM
jgi:alkaline phosphatase